MLPGKSRSQWIVLANRVEDLGKIARNGNWVNVTIVPGPVWRDDFANVLGLWKKPEED
jgi:hypothetical protein